MNQASVEELAQIRRLRLLSFVEALTLLSLLFVAVPLKHVYGQPGLARIMGPIHGAAFVAYMWNVLATVTGGAWSRGETMRLTAAAFIPFGGFFTGVLLRRKEASALAQMERG